MTVTRSAVSAEVDWERWHASREAELAAEYGWLSLTGFAWLPSEPGHLDGLPGQWWATADRAYLRATAADAISVTGTPVDGEVEVTVAEAGSLDWAAIGPSRVQLLRRGGRFAVRTRNPRAPTRERFEGVPVFVYDPAWLVEGRYRPYPAAVQVQVSTARADLRQHVTIAGELELWLEGAEQTLQVGRNADGTLQVLFHDQTNGVETASWRSVTTRLPGPEGDVLVDFNRAVNPPYAFTAYGTCPAPPPGNRIRARVRAGERAPR